MGTGNEDLGKTNYNMGNSNGFDLILKPSDDITSNYIGNDNTMIQTPLI
jgi:hypothetical protein